MPLNAEHTVSLTAINSQARVKTVQDIGNMPFTKFSTLYAVSFLKTVLSRYPQCSLLSRGCLSSVLLQANAESESYSIHFGAH